MRNDFTNASDMPTLTGWYLRSVMAETWTGICNIVLWLVIISTSYKRRTLRCATQVMVNVMTLSEPRLPIFRVLFKVTRPSFFGGYHPTLKLSGIPIFTFIVSLTHRMDNI